MTDATLIPALTRDRRTYVAPAVAGPGLVTFISQAIFGYIVGGFVIALGLVSCSPTPYNFELVFATPVVLSWGLVIGTPLGFILWVWTKLAGEPLGRTYRSTISFLMLAIGCFSLLLIAGWRGEGDPALLLILLFCSPGIPIGIITGSRLRPGRELIRGGEAIELLPRLLAGATGVVLRLIVLLLFMSSGIGLIATVLAYFANTGYYEHLHPAWPVAAFAQFTLSMIVLFVRMRFGWLAFLTPLANAPLMVCLWIVPDIWAPLWYVGIGYLITWTVFLLSRWRQTDVALAAVKEEFRYYLID